MKRFYFFSFLFCFCLVAVQHAQAEINLLKPFGELRFEQPVGLYQAPGDTSRWYLLEQRGVIKIIDKSGKNVSVFADLRDRVESGGEKGLLGVAFHPDYPRTPYLFVSYTSDVNGDLMSRISRFTIKGITFDKGSEQILLSVEQPYGNHNGGQISFGPDNFLYIALGDGGWAGDPKDNGQNKQTLLGSLLRIDVNAIPYRIPKDNPFVKDKKAKAEIYAWGLRNPWRFSFDKLNGDLWLADVGQDDWEEINLVEKGHNYGWNIREGKHCYSIFTCTEKNLSDPIFEYGHDQGQSITGGFVYRGEKIKQLYGHYLYADFVSGKVWHLQRDDKGKVKNQLLKQTDLMISSFAQDNNGELYLLDYKRGHVYQLAP